MKAKLFKIRCYTQRININYDDYSDVLRHIVTNYSDWEELDEKELDRVERWVEETNKVGSHKYMLITESDKTIKEAINEQIKREDKAREEWKRQEEEEKKKREKEKEQRAAKKAEKLKKQLEKLQKELESKKN